MAKKKGLEYIARLSGAAITLVLLMFLVLFAQFFTAELWWQHTNKKLSPPKFPDDPQWSTHIASKLFLPDGTMHLVHRKDTLRNDDYTDDYTKEKITDVNGTFLWQGIHRDRPLKYLAWASFAQNFSERQMQSMFSLSPDLPSVFEVPVRIGGEVKEVWQYDFEAQAFASYEVGGGLMGYLGAGGFVGSKAQVQPFGEFKGFASWTDENPSSVVMLWQTKRRIYQIDFRSRKVETVFDSDQSDIESIRWHQWRPMNPKDRDDSGIQYRPLIDCQTADDKRHLIMREPNQILVVELPEQMREPNQILMRRRSNLDFTATDKTIFAQYREKNLNPPASPKLLEQYMQEYDSKPHPQSLQLYKVTNDGKLNLISRFDWTRPMAKISYPPVRREIIQKWARKASPPVFDLLWYLFGDSLYNFSREGMGLVQGYAAIITEGRPGYSSLNYVLGAAMVAFALWHGWARRTSWGRMLCWLVVVALFGIAGLLTYLALNHTPVIKCPICGKKRGLERFDCIRCGRILPIPQRKPTDLIFSN
ncbi:MAG: hypothetical protein MUO27_01105 [Sedimentisphaerales bacterium]|nr:hypothetical protein [Sedimentisphaerales bacterium]